MKCLNIYIFIRVLIKHIVSIFIAELSPLAGKNMIPMKNAKIFKFTPSYVGSDYTASYKDNPNAQPASLIMQFFLLYMRHFTCSRRNTVSLTNLRAFFLL